jgi:hypothetical protein
VCAQRATATRPVAFGLEEVRPAIRSALLVRHAHKSGDVDHVIPLVADTRGNRLALRALGELRATDFPVPGARALAALEHGHDPGGSAVVVI